MPPVRASRLGRAPLRTHSAPFTGEGSTNAGLMSGRFSEQCEPGWVSNIFVRTLSGRIITLGASADDTVGVLKCKIHNSYGMPVDQQRLVCAGHELKDGETLEECSIQPGHTLHLLRKPHHAGAPHARRAKEHRKSSVFLRVDPLSPLTEFKFDFASKDGARLPKNPKPEERPGRRRTQSMVVGSSGQGWQSWLDTSTIGYQMVEKAAARTAEYMSYMDQDSRRQQDERSLEGDGLLEGGSGRGSAGGRARRRRRLGFLSRIRRPRAGPCDDEPRTTEW